MSRLFWKFFLAIFLAQLVTVGTLSMLFWLHDPRRNPDQTSPPPDWLADGGPGGAHPPPGFAPPGVLPKEHHLPRPPKPPEARYPWLPLSVGLFASLLFAVLLARHFSRPILALRHAFDEVGRGNFDLGLADEMRGRHDELADLGRNFERTAQQVKSLMNGQRRLLHDVSHEVRSPLARMQLAIDLARQQPDKLTASIERIERESGRIDRLMEELLTLARLEARAFSVLDDSVDVAGLIVEIVDDARFEAAAKHCTVELLVTSEEPIKGRVDLIQRAIENVVRNAVRHTFEHTSIRVELGQHGNQLHLIVEDEGPGVPEAALDAMFEPFVRFHNAAGEHGHGLGLAITREVIQAHGGQIQVSNRPSGGLRLLIKLPIAA